MSFSHVPFSSAITLVILFGVSSFFMIDFGIRLRKLTGKKRYTWIPMGWMVLGSIALAASSAITEAVHNGHLLP